MTHFLIVTPSLNRLDDLRRCIASVADQAAESMEHGAGRIEIHHHVQDACSTDGTVDWLRQYDEEIRGSQSGPNNQYPITNNYRLSWSSAPDGGMYDAIRKGWTCGMGAPINGDPLTVNRNDSTDNQSVITNNCDDAIVAWLNCDEQYLEGALARAAGYFRQHPETEVLFGDALVVRPDGTLLCARRAVLPERNHMLTSYLTVFSAALFIRARAVREKNLFPDTEWKILGDVDLVDRMISSGVRFGVIRRFLAAFTDSGRNISLTSDRVCHEQQTLAARLSPSVRALKPLWRWRHRVRKLLSGAYRHRMAEYSVFTDRLSQRTNFSVRRAPVVWKGRL